MHVFVTGAGGSVGSVVQDLMDAAHHVTGLTRSDEKAAQLAAAGATVLRSTLDDPMPVSRATIQALRDWRFHCRGLYQLPAARDAQLATHTQLHVLGKTSSGRSCHRWRALRTSRTAREWRIISP